VPRLWEGDHAYILQQPDGRFVFALPYGAHSLVGTTDVPVERPEDAAITADEVEYLCAAVNFYFRAQTAPGDVVWSYSGIRSLFDDGSAKAKDISRDFRLELDQGPGGKLLSVFGGKVTTARALATEALDKLGVGGLKFTRTTPLPGGDVDAGFNAWLADLATWMPAPLLERLSRAYGTRLQDLLDGVETLEALGRDFGAGLYEKEVRYLVDAEFARTAEDILWRRTKLGLVMSPEEKAALAEYIGN